MRRRSGSASRQPLPASRCRSDLLAQPRSLWRARAPHRRPVDGTVRAQLVEATATGAAFRHGNALPVREQLRHWLLQRAHEQVCTDRDWRVDELLLGVRVGAGRDNTHCAHVCGWHADHRANVCWCASPPPFLRPACHHLTASGHRQQERPADAQYHHRPGAAAHAKLTARGRGGAARGRE